MFRIVVMVAAAAVVGFAGAVVAFRNDVVSLPRSWQVVKLEEAARSKMGSDHPECFPDPAIISDSDRISVRSNFALAVAELPEESKAILSNLLRGDGPVPYKGQMAIRVAAQLISLKNYQACLSSNKLDCTAGSAAHLFTDRTIFSERKDINTAFKIGLHVGFLRTDLANSAFCVHR